MIDRRPPTLPPHGKHERAPSPGDEPIEFTANHPSVLEEGDRKPPMSGEQASGQKAVDRLIQEGIEAEREQQLTEAQRKIQSADTVEMPVFEDGTTKDHPVAHDTGEYPAVTEEMLQKMRRMQRTDETPTVVMPAIEVGDGDIIAERSKDTPPPAPAVNEPKVVALKEVQRQRMTAHHEEQQRKDFQRSKEHIDGARLEKFQTVHAFLKEQFDHYRDIREHKALLPRAQRREKQRRAETLGAECARILSSIPENIPMVGLLQDQLAMNNKEAPRLFGFLRSGKPATPAVRDTLDRRIQREFERLTPDKELPPLELDIAA